MTLEEKALQLHYEMQGKIEVVSRKSVCTYYIPPVWLNHAA